MPLVIVLLGIALLLVLIIVFKLNAFIAFIIVSLLVGVAEGLAVIPTVEAIKAGIGSIMSSLIIILGFGAMLGKLVADSGAAYRITTGLVAAFGLKRIQLALMVTGFIVGIPMFYSVGFVILVPLVFTMAASTGLPLLYVGIPMLASLSVTHGYLPPHPAPTAIVGMFQADMGTTLLYGILIAIPAILVAGPLLSGYFSRFEAKPLEAFTGTENVAGAKAPSLGSSLVVALSPVILIGFAALIKLWVNEDSFWWKMAEVAGNPSIAMLIAVLAAIYFLGIRNGQKMPQLMESISSGVSGITMVLLIIAGAGAFKQVLIESGVSDYIAALMQGSGFSPLFLAWLIAAVVRVCVGSATVAGLTSAGIVVPLVGHPDVSPELMVLAIGSGSLMLSHVNDGGFWLFKEYFNLSIKETLSTWTVMETTVSAMGLVGVMVLDWLVN